MSKPELDFFSPVQRRVIAAGGTALAAALLLGFLFVLFRILQSFVGTFQDVLLPLAIAAILATLLRPLITFCDRHSRLGQTQSIALLYFLVVLVLAMSAVFFVPLVYQQLAEVLRHAPEIRDNVLDFLKASAPAFWAWLEERLGEPPDTYLKSLLSDNSDAVKEAIAQLQTTAGSLRGFFGGLFGKIAAYSIIPVYLFFILRGKRDVWKDIDTQLRFLPDDRRDDVVFLGRQFSDILIAFFRGQILIGLLLGCVLAIGFGLVGLKFGILVGFALGLLNIIPYLGTMIGILTVLPLAYFQDGGGVTLVAVCSGVFILGQILTDYVFTPRVMGDKTGMSPMLIIFSVFFWGTALGGILGMVLAIPLTAFFLVFWRLARDKYLPALTQRKEAVST